jgi:hypothetical protein
MEVWLLAVGLALVGAVAGAGWLLGRTAARQGRPASDAGPAAVAPRAPDPPAKEPTDGPTTPIAGDAPAAIETCARCLAACEERGGGAACETVCRMAGECA